MSDMKLTLDSDIPKAPWTTALFSTSNPTLLLPQAIAHRGYKAAWPENSLEAMRAAVEAGAHAVETDVHLSRDGVVVLSHDPNLKRCFGVDRKIVDCDWEYLAGLRSLRKPHVRMPRFVDLLEWLCEDGMEHVWVLLDIKINDAADDLVPALAKAFTSIQGAIPWNSRFVLGCWNATYITTTRRLLPSFPLSHISFSTSYTTHFLNNLPRLGVNMLQHRLAWLLSSRFLRRVQDEHRPLFVWTVNEMRAMEWCLRQNAGGDKCIDGVVTDDPRLFREVCRRWEDGEKVSTAIQEKGMAAWREVMTAVMWMVLIYVFRVGLFWVRRLKGHYDYLGEVRARR